jgi:DNA modification methylase
MMTSLRSLWFGRRPRWVIRGLSVCSFVTAVILMPKKSRKPELTTAGKAPANPKTPARRCNSLDGKRWLQNSISVWSDIRKSPEELRLKHPALFPAALAMRLMESFLPSGSQTVLDPFAGVGSTLIAAAKLGKQAIGLELSPEFVAVAIDRPDGPRAAGPATGLEKSSGRRKQSRLQFEAAEPADGSAAQSIIYNASATDLLQYVPENSIDMCVTSPPYWDILNQRRTADSKAVRHYGNLESDLGTIADYDEFLSALTKIFADVLRVLKPGAHCCIVVMDLRKKNRFYPFHSDLASRLQAVGYEFDDLIIWNRQSEYNNLRPLGYPAVFRVNKVHEFVVLMRKP